MTAPIVHPWTGALVDLHGLRRTFEEVEPKAARDVAAAHAGFDTPPKGQLWERLAEVRIWDVIDSPVYTNAIADGYFQAKAQSAERNLGHIR